MRPNSEIYTPKRDDEHPHPFDIRTPPPRVLNSPVRLYSQAKTSSLFSHERIFRHLSIHMKSSRFFFPCINFTKNQKLLRVVWSYTLKVSSCKPDKKSEQFTCDLKLFEGTRFCHPGDSKYMSSYLVYPGE